MCPLSSSRHPCNATIARKLLGISAVMMLALTWESAASAYIDPTTSGTLMQIIAPVLIALGVLRQRIMLALRMIAARVRRFIDGSDRA